MGSDRRPPGPMSASTIGRASPAPPGSSGLRRQGTSWVCSAGSTPISGDIRREFPLAVIYKYVDDSGGYLAALIAYYAFVSLFPLLLLLSTVLGLVLVGDPDLQHRVLNSALHEFPVVGAQLSDPKRISGGTAGLVIGVAGLALRRPRGCPGRPVRHEHRVAGASQQPSQPVQGARAQLFCCWRRPGWPSSGRPCCRPWARAAPDLGVRSSVLVLAARSR